MKRTKESYSETPAKPALSEEAQCIELLTEGGTRRGSAVILHITSLPGPFGIGVLGEEALAFAKKLAASETAYWQILPLYLPIDHSPYNSLSTFAGNTRLIDPRGLVKMDLLRSDELEQYYYTGSEHRTDYGFAAQNSEKYLRAAFRRLKENQQQAMQAFIQEKAWLPAYAAFRILHEKYGTAWWEWPEDERGFSSGLCEAIRREESGEFYFYCFGQWIFHLQWRELRTAVNAMGVGILGDIPYYVAADSADTWSSGRNFLLKRDGSPAWVAGVPPDYFAENGQLWGNTVYDWERLRAEDFAWWYERLAGTFELYNALRLDHFRAFDSYWRIPADAETAREGSWRPGPGLDFFTKLREKFGPLPIIAEDLGILTDEVRTLVRRSGFPGMKVLQFAFASRADNIDQPHHFEKNLCVYTGTHDNDTLLGWIWSCSEEERKYVLRYIGFPEDEDWGKGGVFSPFCRAMLRTAWSSVARLAACPIQDLLGYGTDTRMNTPGVVEGQWEFRLDTANLEAFPTAQLQALNRLYDRARAFRDKPAAKTPSQDSSPTSEAAELT